MGLRPQYRLTELRPELGVSAPRSGGRGGLTAVATMVDASGEGEGEGEEALCCGAMEEGLRCFAFVVPWVQVQGSTS